MNKCCLGGHKRLFFQKHFKKKTQKCIVIKYFVKPVLCIRTVVAAFVVPGATAVHKAVVEASSGSAVLDVLSAIVIFKLSTLTPASDIAGRFADEMAVICIEVAADVVDGVIVSGNTDSFDVMAVSCLEVSKGILFEVVVFGSTDVIEFLKDVGCLG